MKYVLDSSVAFKWFIPESNTDKALRLLDDYQNGIHDLLSPDESVFVDFIYRLEYCFKPSQGLIVHRIRWI
jgi:predicted nucleic acid-binding protein